MKVYKLLLYLLTILALIIQVIVDINYTLALPLVYLLSLSILNFTPKDNFIVLKVSYELLGFIRLVNIPFLITLTKDDKVDNLPLGYSVINQGYTLMGIEYVIGALTILILSNLIKVKKNRLEDVNLLGSKVFYSLFIIIAIGILLVVPGIKEGLSFTFIKTTQSGRESEQLPSYIVLLRMFFQFAMILLFLLFSFKNYKKYVINPNIKYLVIPLLLASINISIIVGERRSYQIYTLLAIVGIITLLFKKHSKIINKILISIGGLVFIGVTLYKELYIFKYASYQQALSSNSLGQLKFVDTLQSYFYGPHNIGSFIKYSQYFDVTFVDFVLDIIRSIFVLNFFINENYLLLSQRFNLLMYDNEQMTGHLISSSAYGFSIFGYGFGIIIILNIFLIALVEYIANLNKYLEIKFISYYVLMRFTFSTFSNTPQLLSHATMVIGVFGAVVIVSYLLRKLSGSLILTKSIKGDFYEE
ncbi:capsular biosynthesis protein [Staphylococcus massiliensis CCUG 55927]|uniref:hypothetical protein n=1 Tax=Staphylococcus massiliensis TaxID=555791 RepID=UPI0002E098F8|nr:hypothetical protein [Staphylococcus massiliensis]POA00549.1 capsular biosynthesis protein [Staphylococcus massiliensis CCUG 55927]